MKDRDPIENIQPTGHSHHGRVHSKRRHRAGSRHSDDVSAGPQVIARISTPLIEDIQAAADLLNQEARALQADGVDVIQFDEPAFNVYMDDVVAWGVEALHRASAGLTCTTAVHICYGYGIKANIDWKASLGSEWRQYEAIFPALAKSRIQQVSLECTNSHVPPDLMALLAGKDVLVGVIDVANDKVETPEEVADTIGRALQFVAKERLYACTNCGMAPMAREIAVAKLEALAKGAALARQRYG